MAGERTGGSPGSWRAGRKRNKAVILRGLFDTNGGLGSGELITATDSGGHAGECP